jgi:hypothetical protein
MRSTVHRGWLLDLVVVTLFAGCATPGLHFPAHPASTAVVPTDRAHVIVFSTRDNSYPPPYDLQELIVAVDGADVATLWIGTFTMLQLPPGQHRLAAHYPWWPGRCYTVMELIGGTRYFAQVSPWFSFEPPAADSVAPGTYSPFNLLALIHPLGDLAVRQSNPCGGFTIRLQDEATALPKLANVPASP